MLLDSYFLSGMPDIISLQGQLLQTLQFQWSKQQVGLSLTLIGVIGFFVQAYVLQYLSKRLTDHKLIYLGLGVSFIGLVLLSFCTTTVQLWIGITLYLLGSVQQTGFQSMLSKSVDPQYQGELQGVLGSFLVLILHFRYLAVLNEPLESHSV